MTTIHDFRQDASRNDGTDYRSRRTARRRDKGSQDQDSLLDANGAARAPEALRASPSQGQNAPKDDRKNLGNPPLGTNAKHQSARLEDGSDLRISRRHGRHVLRELAGKVTKNPKRRVWHCGRSPIANHGHDGCPVIMLQAIAHFAGLQTCGSIWTCAVCSGKIRAKRSIEVSSAAARWIRQGNSVYMVTLTVPHGLWMPLADTWSVFADGWSDMVQAYSWVGRGPTLSRAKPGRPNFGKMLPAKPGFKQRNNIVGQIRTIEVTYGEAGWHPHTHALIFVKGQEEGCLGELVLYFSKQWVQFCRRRGYRDPSVLHGVNVRKCYAGKEAGDYICKTQDGKSPGNEIARADLKQGKQKGRTPFQILDDYGQTG